MGKRKRGGFVTYHREKNGRINLGTCKHATMSCHSIRDKSVYFIEGPLSDFIPNCKICFRNTRQLVIPHILDA